jgi:hypothetical protein
MMMCRLSFFANTIGEIILLIENRVIDFKNLLSLGFESTLKADKYSVLNHRIYIIDNNLLSEYSEKNLYYIDVSFVLKDAINILDKHVNNLKNDIEKNDIQLTMLTSSYIEIIRNRKIKRELQEEINKMLNESKYNLNDVIIDIPLDYYSDVKSSSRKDVQSSKQSSNNSWINFNYNYFPKFNKQSLYSITEVNENLV